MTFLCSSDRKSGLTKGKKHFIETFKIPLWIRLWEIILPISLMKQLMFKNIKWLVRIYAESRLLVPSHISHTWCTDIMEKVAKPSQKKKKKKKKKKEKTKKKEKGSSCRGLQKQIWLASMRMQVWWLASLSGLRIWHFCELWCRSQMQFGSGIAVAVV